jgi:hypothetical protein
VVLLIFLLVPEAATQRHLEILSEIAEMLSDRELRERLKTEPDAAVVHKLISDWEPLKSVAWQHREVSLGPHEAHLHQRRGAVRGAPRSPALGVDRRPRAPRAPLRRRAVRDARSAADLVGYLNYIHPYRVQIVGRREVAYLSASSPEDQERRISRIVTLEPPVHHRGRRLPRRRRPPGGHVRPRRDPAVRHPRIGRPRHRRGARLPGAALFADRTTRHGVFMDILGLGVLLTGESAWARANWGWN